MDHRGDRCMRVRDSVGNRLFVDGGFAQVRAESLQRRLIVAALLK
jgi:hypothetical protein